MDHAHTPKALNWKRLIWRPFQAHRATLKCKLCLSELPTSEALMKSLFIHVRSQPKPQSSPITSHKLKKIPCGKLSSTATRIKLNFLILCLPTLTEWPLINKTGNLLKSTHCRKIYLDSTSREKKNIFLTNNVFKIVFLEPMVREAGQVVLITELLRA